MNNFNVPSALKKELPKLTIAYIVFVFTHLTSSYSYAEDIEDKVYYMDDSRLDDPDDLPDQETYRKLFFQYLCEALEKGKAIIELPYNPYMAFLLSVFKTEIEKRKLTNILTVSFFHTDQDIESRADEYREAALEINFQAMASMIKYPFIKKIELPIDAVLTGDFLRDLMKDSAMTHEVII
ncbi:MAG: hypothetical protein LBK63_08940 [Treponema sp.]|jgi:hypothetical protein|nr:hypothetical protein [Treponema sp.]